MALPDNFSPAEHLQDVMMMVQNKIVRAEFNDVGDDTWERDITTPRGSLRVACTHVEGDCLGMTQLRLDLFYLVLRKAQDFHPAIYGTPSTSFQETTKFHPQVHLYFVEKTAEADAGYDPLRSQISLRLMNETTETITIAELTIIANKIKTLFHAGTPFFWKRGKELFSYIDQKNGYYFQILAFDTTNAKKLVEQVLDIRGHVPDWKLLNKKSNDEPSVTYPTIPTPKTILGKSIKPPRRRPVGTVHFIYATCAIHGKPKHVVLYDPDRRFAESLVR